MVIPRAFSSGALSIWSNATAVLPPVSAMTCMPASVVEADVSKQFTVLQAVALHLGRCICTVTVTAPL